MATLTKKQVERLAEIIEQHATWFAWKVFGKTLISDSDLDALKASGTLPMDVRADSIKYAYVLGRLESVLKKNEWKSLTWDQLKSEAEGKLTEIDRLQIEAAELSVYTQFRGLADDIKAGLYERLSGTTQHVITEAFVRNTIKDTIRTGIEVGASYHNVASTLARELKETKRSWTRVAATEMQTARQKGVATAIATGVGIYEDAEGTDSMVFVDHGPTPCEDCDRIYNDPQTGNPKVFRLSDLMANEGTNYIRPWRVNAQPVIPPLHPHCYGRLRYMPPGWGFDDKGQMTLVSPAEAYPGLIEPEEEE